MLSSRTWVIVLNFMALLAARNPLMRSRAERFYGDRMLQELDRATDTPEKFAAVVAAAQNLGDLYKNLKPDYKGQRAFLVGRKFKLSFDPGFHAVGEFKTVDALVKQFVSRRWLLLEAPSERRICHNRSAGDAVNDLLRN